MTELLIGCGERREKCLWFGDNKEWSSLITLDMNPDVAPDVVHDLADLPLPFKDDTFDEIQSIEVLEHVGTQGDWRFFFAQFEDFWRILKPGGLFAGTCPSAASVWAWGDPGHTRIISPQSLSFLHQPNYGHPPRTDYRRWYKADFDPVHSEERDGVHIFGLRAVKPARIG